MTAGAAPVPGRRVSLGAAVVVASYLLLAPRLYLLGPFAVLTLLSRPRSSRELIWLVLASAGVAYELTGDQTLVPQLLRTSEVIMGAAFVLLSLRSSQTLLTRVSLALAIMIAGLIIWGWAYGVTWSAVETAFADTLRDISQMWAQAKSGDADYQAYLQQVGEVAPRAARLLPGMLAVQAMAGCALGWIWHHQIASSPLGRPPRRFREFRFNDHLVWGAIFTLGAVLLHLPPLARTIAANLLIVWVGLYTVRGVAIIAAVFAQAPTSVRVIAMGLASPICAVLGLADTWLDFRGRLVPPAS